MNLEVYSLSIGGDILTDDAFGKDTTFVGISMTEDYMQKVFGGNLPGLFLSPKQYFSLHLTEEEQKTWEHYIHTLCGLVNIEGMDMSHPVRTILYE